MGLGRVFLIGRYDFSQTRRNPSQTVSPSFSFSPLAVFWFLFGFEGWFHPFSDRRGPPDENVDYPNPMDFIECLEAIKAGEMVREERVELSTFGSGGRRSIQLSYSRTTTRL